MSIPVKIYDPKHTNGGADACINWSPTMYLRQLEDKTLQQLWTSMMPDGSPLSEWRNIETFWDVMGGKS